MIKEINPHKLLSQLVQAFSGAIDAKDEYTNGHSLRVADYSVEIAKRYGYSKEQRKIVYMAGLLHDIGKIGVPDGILNKTDRLTDEEFKIIQRHTIVGSDILETISEVPELKIGARWHHEKYDGTGYPDHLVGKDIPEIARIIAVADAYDAMTSNRSYRKIMPIEKVISEINNGIGTQFSPEFAEIMLKMIDEGGKTL